MAHLMTITTKRTICNKYIVTAHQNGLTGSAMNASRKQAFSDAIQICYKLINIDNL